MSTNTKGPTMIATEPKCITECREKLERQIRELDWLAAHVNVASEVFADREDAELRIPYTVDCVSVDVYFDDLADALPYLRELAKRGYHAQRGHEFYEDDSKAFRCYTRGEIKVWAHITGAKCKRVQVGTKTMPVYAIQCGEEATA